ncbi:MAG: hypothetical protein C4346_19755 [Chloroflexota bacterium]
MKTFEQQHSEAGATIVLLALSLVALMALAGLVVDGGAAYADRRQTQNAADAAALAGATALNKCWQPPLDGTTDLVCADGTGVWRAVRDKLVQNRANGAFDCTYVGQDGVLLPGTCDTYNGKPVPVAATGVDVVARDTQPTTFMRVLGITQFSARAQAQARVQALVNGGQAPVMVCAVADGDPRSGGKGIQQISPGEQIPILLPDDTINPRALHDNPQAPIYWIKGVEVKDTCKMGNQWKGVVNQGHGSHNDGRTYPLPGIWEGDTGNQSGPTRTKVVGACNDEGTVGCKIQVPLCYWKSGIPQRSLYCARMGVFEIARRDANSYAARLVAEGGVVDIGDGGGKPLPGEARVIKLTL